MNNLKDFEIWNKKKQKLDSRKSLALFPKVAEVWIISLGKNIGSEQNGSGSNFLRPVLIVKRFNNQMFWAVPLTSKQKELSYYYNFTDLYGNEVAIILAQLRLISVNRFYRKIYRLPLEQYDLVLDSLSRMVK